MQQEAVTQFKGQFRGELIEPTDARYEEARKVYNGGKVFSPGMGLPCSQNPGRNT
jgi:hypothetical protein